MYEVYQKEDQVMKRYIRSAKYNGNNVHEYKGHKILRITSCGQKVWKVQGMPQDFYDKYWFGEFERLVDVKKYVDKYEKEKGAQK